MTEFKCLRCGKCCGIVPFEKSDVDNLGDTGVVFEPQVVSGRVCWVPKSALATGKCPFYNRRRRICEIYERRPMVCRKFGPGPHPCLICPNSPDYSDEKVRQVAERVFEKAGDKII